MCICRTLLYTNRGVHKKWELLFCILSHTDNQHGQHPSCGLYAKSLLCSSIPRMGLIYVRDHDKKQWPICRRENSPVCELPTYRPLLFEVVPHISDPTLSMLEQRSDLANGLQLRCWPCRNPI